MLLNDTKTSVPNCIITMITISSICHRTDKVKAQKRSRACEQRATEIGKRCKLQVCQPRQHNATQK